MPLYEVCHSVPLSRDQKDSLAEFITLVHSTTFRTPKLFVNVHFTQPGPKGDFYVAGKPREPTSPNHIIALVRVGPTRTKEQFDEVAVKIQRKWYEVVDDAALAAHSLGNLTTKEEKRFKKLHFVVFHAMVAALENGVVIPGAGDEGTWLKDNMAFFQEQIDVYDDDEFRDMVKEIHEREDLRKLVEL